MRFLIPQYIDLARENAPLVYAQPLIGGDSGAHEWQVHVRVNGKEAALDGCSATAYICRDIVRDDGVDEPALRVECIVSNNVCSAVFPADVYDMNSPLVAVMRVATVEGDMAALAVLRATSESLLSGAVYDPDGEIVNLDELLAQISTMKTATEDANTATDNANAAAEKANASAAMADASAKKAEEAETGASGWANATMTATGLSAGSTPTATVTTASDGHKVITLGIPKGDTGATPDISVEVSTGEPGTDAQVSVSGTAENPVIHLTTPRGETGAIENLTINGKPVENGKVTLTAEDVGALGKTEQAADSAKLGGKMWDEIKAEIKAEIKLEDWPEGSIYMAINDISPASLFGGTWEQLYDRFLVGAGQGFDVGTTGGESEVTLSLGQIPKHSHEITTCANTGTISNPGSMLKLPGIEYGAATGGSGHTLLETITAGSGGTHNNIPPYLAVNMWKRVG